MWYFFGIIFFILTILVFINRLWVKRRIKKERIINILILTVLICSLIWTMINFIKFKDKTQKSIIKEELEILEEQGEFYSFDKNGNIIKENKTIGDMISEAFIKDVFNTNTNISNDEFIKNNISVVVISVILIVYWITLLLLYEREDKFYYKQQDDFQLMEKYNPMIAACIAQNRKVMGRDIIAVILGLIEKGKINLRIVPDESSSKIKYKYMISPKLKRLRQSDLIEEYIFEWLFENIENHKKNKTEYDYISVSPEGIVEIDLIKRIKEFSVDENTYYKIKEITEMANEKLKKVGANNESVPFGIRMINFILMFFIVLIVGNHICINGLGIVINNFQILIVMFALILLLSVIPIIYIFSLIILKTIMILFKSIEELTQKHTGRNLIAKAISIFVATILLMSIILLMPIDTYLVYDVFIIGIGFLIIQTDNYMLKHSKVVLDDYYNLKRIEDKIQNYSLIQEKNIEYLKIWNKYYVYSVALGIPLKVNNESIIDYNIDSKLIINAADMQAICYVCKSYFEVMWDFEFDDEKSIINIISKLRNYINK